MSDPGFRLRRSVGLLAIIASAVAGEYGAGINFVAVQSLGVYPGVRSLVPLAMFLTGLVLITKVYMFARFSRVMPRAGSAYVWIVRSVSPSVGFVVSFLWWISLTAAMGFIAFAFSTFLAQAIGSVGIPAAAITTPLGRTIIGLAAIWLVYGIHAAGVHHYGRFVSILLWIIVATALVITLIGFLTTPAHFVELAAARTGKPITPPAGDTSVDLMSFLSVCSLFIFAYGGVSAAPALGGEARDAERVMPRGVVLGWLVALVLYTLVSAALLHAAPWWAILALISQKHSELVTAPGLVGLVAPHWISVLLNFSVALIVGKTLGPQLMTGSRLLFAWAQDGLVPRRLGETSDSHAPSGALALTAALASLFLLQSVFVGWSLGVVIRSFSLLLVWMLVGIGALRLRYGARRADQGWADRLVADVWMVPAAIGSIVVTAVLIYAIAIVPNTPMVFQPLFQSFVAAIVAMLLLWRAHGRAAASGHDLRAALAAPPLE
ncbi:MAG: APC family permease [Rhodospirillales bacterium]|nr:APC family permease [Rhodospirillales bacterium]